MTSSGVNGYRYFTKSTRAEKKELYCVSVSIQTHNSRSVLCKIKASVGMNSKPSS